MFTDLLTAIHCNTFHDQKSLKNAWVETNVLWMLTASEVIGTKVPVLDKYTFATL